MLKFTGNYSITNNNFVIQNVDKRTKNKKSKYFPLICVIKNILFRGLPSNPSKYLKDNLGEISLERGFKIISKEPNVWHNTIKGDDKRRFYPAKEFIYDILPNNLRELEFITRLMIPEVLINEITGTNQEGFESQQVDFYLPQAKLVVEIDGQQHKHDDINRINDVERNEHLNKYGIKTVRIDTKDLYNQQILDKKLNEIKNRCTQFYDKLKEYELEYSKEKFTNEEKKHIEYSVVLRLQILILSLLEYGVIELENPDWKFNIKCNEDYDIKKLSELALADLFIWLEQICKLKGIEFRKPNIDINIGEEISNTDNININFSLKKRWTDECDIYSNEIFIRTDYFDEKDYFKVSTADPINYKIIYDGEKSNIESIKFFLKNIFGFSEFNDGQLPIVVNALNGNDTVGLLPTGGGKSLCYQFAVIMQPCVNFCVVPIKSLMLDQKETLDRRGIVRTNYISGEQNYEEKDKICQEFAQGKYFVIWISPERFQTRAFRDYLYDLNRSQTIALAVIDEVHCLSEWGHDFRTSYLQLCNTIRKYCPSTKFLGLTATASLNVLNDILVEFETTKDNVKTMLEYTRPELTFIVQKDESERSSDKFAKLSDLLEKLDKKKNIFEVKEDKLDCGIIFTVNKNGKMGCYELTSNLSQKYPKKVRWYSGELPKKLQNSLNIAEFNEYKKKTQKDFKANKFPLLISTKAFGMGIDKGNVRYTIHFGLPGSLESLYQEAGRAGRDKNKAGCYILYSRELLSKEDMDILFSLDTNIEQINDILQKQSYDARDVLRNFYLWKLNNIGVDKESQITSQILKSFAKPGKRVVVSCGEIRKILDKKQFEDINIFSISQKAIYRLSLLGIISDWTIEGWDKNGKFDIQFNKFDNKSITHSLTKYIRKYEADFSFEKLKKNDKYKEIIEEECDYAYIIIKILIQWNYDNVFYNRRQSLKTLVDLCEDYNKEKENKFKERIESYFKFTEDTYVLEHISQNPKDYERWFQIFFDEEGNIKNTSQLQDSIYSLTRFLESFRYNIGLNYISGLLRLVLGNFDSVDGRERFKNSLSEIVNFKESEKEEILAKTLEISKLIKAEDKENLSYFLCRYFNDKKIEIYKNLEDNTSLNLILKEKIENLKNIGGNFR